MSINCESNANHLPDWVPWQGKFVYETVLGNGGYSEDRHSNSFTKLFDSKYLDGVWRAFSDLQISLDGWAFLLGGIVLAIECAPSTGKRATRDTLSDNKIKILERQKSADMLLQKIADTADDLSNLLWQLRENGGDVPAETYSGLALIEKVVEQIGMASATCGKPFKNFRIGLSSYAKQHFPSPIEIVDELAHVAKNHPKHREIFADDPWLSSGQSSWKDYVRVIRGVFAECRMIYGDSPVLTDAHWHALVRVMIDDSISRQAVSKGLREL